MLHGQSMRPRVLVVTRNLPPAHGGMERLLEALIEALAQCCELAVVGPRDAVGLPVLNDLDMTGCPMQPAAGFLLACQLATWQVARQLRPQVIIAGSGLTAPAAWWAARRSGARAVTYLHGLDIGNRHPLYGLGFVPCIRACTQVWANSRFTGDLAQARGIPRDRLRTLYPVASLDTDQNATDATDFKQRWAGHRVLLSAGRLVPRKGLPSFVEHVFPLILRQHPQAILAIAGDEAHGGIKRQDGEGQRIRQAAARAGVLEHLDWLGWLAPDAMQAAYAAADVLVFPVQHHPTDPEGFGMVAIEAAGCGLPTVAYATGGVCEAVEHGLSGCLVPPGDVAGFAQAVTTLLDAPSRAMASGCRGFAEQFSKERFAMRVHGLLMELLQTDAHALLSP